MLALREKTAGNAVRLGMTLGAIVFAALGLGNTASAAPEMRVSGLVSTHKFHVALEREFYKSLADKTGIKINYNPLDVVGGQFHDGRADFGRTGKADFANERVGGQCVAGF